MADVSGRKQAHDPGDAGPADGPPSWSAVSIAPKGFARKAGLGIPEAQGRHFRSWLLLAPPFRVPEGIHAEEQRRFLAR
jgi:hypothetical protein